MSSPTSASSAPHTVPAPDSLDRRGRQDVVAITLRAARQRKIELDSRCLDIFQRYIAGELSDTDVVAAIKAPHLH